MSLEIKSMENLAVLDLSYNQLKTLPDWIGDLRSLKRLNLRWNELEALPDSFAELKKACLP